MPKLIIQTETRNGRPTAVTLSERILPSEVHSDHYLGQLVERVGWALLDAQDLEGRQ